MIPTVSWISRKFDEFNAEYFDGKLRKCAFRISSSRSYWGMCSWKYVPGTRRSVVKPDSEVISISKFYDCEEHHLEETLIHEMIHLMFVQNNKPHVNHGLEFKLAAAKISRRGKHRIKVTDDTKFAVSDEIRKKKQREFKVLVMRHKYAKTMHYMTAAPGISEAQLAKIIKEVDSYYPEYVFVGTCVSRHDMFCGRQATIKPSGRWSIWKFESRDQYEEVWNSSTNKISQAA